MGEEGVVGEAEMRVDGMIKCWSDLKKLCRTSNTNQL